MAKAKAQQGAADKPAAKPKQTAKKKNASPARSRKPQAKYEHPGQPTKLTKEIIEQVATYIKAGNYIETSCLMSGITRQTMHGWMKAGREGKDALSVQFFNAIERAQAEAEARDVALIGRAAQTQWTAAAWRLERKYPDRWGRSERVEMTHQGGMAIATGSVDLTPDEKKQFRENWGAMFPGVPLDPDDEL